MKTPEERFEIVEDVFNSIDEEFQLTESGITPFLPTNRREIFNAMKYIVDKDLVDKEKVFIDLGSGLGDVTTVVSYCFNIPTIGIEADKELVAKSWEINNTLTNILGPTNLRYIEDDYTLQEHYENLDVGIVYNYLAGDIASVLQIMPSGTYFLSYLLGGELGLPTDREKALKIIMRKPEYKAGKIEISEHLTELLDKYAGWEYDQLIPNTSMHLYYKTDLT